ncbi:hypothetical protein WJX82_001811 [Trebouxia sp. C0006]
MLGYGGWWGQVGAQSQARQAAGDVEGCSEAGQAQSAADSHDLSGRLAGRAAESGYAAQNRRAGYGHPSLQNRVPHMGHSTAAAL